MSFVKLEIARSGQIVYVDVNKIERVYELLDGNAEIVFSSGKSLHVAGPAKDIVEGGGE